MLDGWTISAMAVMSSFESPSRDMMKAGGFLRSRTYGEHTNRRVRWRKLAKKFNSACAEVSESEICFQSRDVRHHKPSWAE